MRPLAAFVTAFAMLIGSVNASEPRVIQWNDLKAATGFADPFKDLEPQQLQDLGHLIRLRRLIAAKKIPADGEDAQEATEIEKRLRDAKIDIEWLLAQRRAVRRMREQEGFAVQERLKNESVTLAGFVIPLKRDAGKVTEFLLVPAFDFCCRVVPPPPNQTVYVRSDRGVTIPGRFAAALISGTVSTRQSKWSIQRDDRKVEFIASYSITPRAIKVHTTESELDPPGIPGVVAKVTQSDR